MINSAQAKPLVRFGTWGLPEADGAAQAVQAALEAGYRGLDTAAGYANERYVGQGIAASGVERTALSITGKLWNTKRSAAMCAGACKNTLRNLKLSWLDVYLMHWPASPALHADWREINSDTWKGMEALCESGIVRAVGVSNFLPHHLEALSATAHMLPAVNQIELHPGHPQTETLRYCAEHGIAVEAWSPLGSGALLQHPLVQKIAARYHKLPAQICLRWCIQKGAAPVVRSANAVRMAENLCIEDFELSETDLQALDTMEDCGYSGMDPDTITQFG